MIFYESVHRVDGAIRDMIAVFGATRPASIGRELTKLHEQSVMADLQALEAMLADARIPRKGEFVLVVGGSGPVPTDGVAISAAALLRELVAVLPGRQAVDIAARLLGSNRNDLYQRMLAMKKAGDTQ